MMLKSELDDTGTLVVERKFLGAPVRLLWKAWKDDWHLQAWWPESVTMSFQPGGKLVFAWPKKGYELRGRFVDLVQENLIAFTWNWAHADDSFPLLTTIRFVPEDNGLSTVLRIEQRSFDAEADAEEIQSLIEGWTHFLEKLENYLGQMTLV